MMVVVKKSSKENVEQLNNNLFCNNDEFCSNDNNAECRNNLGSLNIG